MRRLTVALAGSALLAASLAAGQAGAEAPPKIPDQNSVPEKIGPPLGARPDDPGTTGSTRKLDDGVIEPRTNAPDMRVRPPVPDPGTTPVIPPPGTPATPRTSSRSSRPFASGRPVCTGGRHGRA